MQLPEEKWTLLKGESDNHPFFMLVNDGLKYFEGKSDYSYCLIVTIDLEETQNHRLPTDEEAETLNKMEDILIDEISQSTICLNVGRETYFGEREILIYMPALQNYKVMIDSISIKLNEYRNTSIALHHDPDWNEAKRYLGSQHNA